ncbi:hypothetical protein KP509_18G039500 [Ceratopteris richardii]|uniref:Peptidase M3A/M3B catalytic domain-containing protein n=1 Tax=Ceratopteris richardii TaxID=49495 RepID=A0A8T2SS42_CERRI|nr:hypothetical protein KP509_18G039500 [Ceratopteris richardii]
MVTRTSRQRQQQAIQYAGAAIAVFVAGKLLRRIFKAIVGDKSNKFKFLIGLEPSQIRKLAQELIERSQRVHDQVAAVPLQKVSYVNVIAPLARLEAEEFALMQSCKFPRLVSTSKEARQASLDAEKMLDEHKSKCRFLSRSKIMREDVYLVIKTFCDKKFMVQPEEQRFIDRLVKDYERKGLRLRPEMRGEAERLNARIGELCNVFQNNINEDESSLSFTVGELTGMHSDFIKSLNTGEDGKLKVTLKPIHYFPIMEYCKVRATRSAVAAARYRRCMKENTPLLEKVLDLRHKLARLLGYKNWAEYSLELCMAKKPEKVQEFQEKMVEHITPAALRELKLLQDLKEEEEGNSVVGLEDILYYIQKAERRMINLDINDLSQYFPVDTVTSGILKIYEHLLGLKLQESRSRHVWHEDVREYEVFDSEKKACLGIIYLDLFSRREGKYNHACVVPLQPGCDLDDSCRQVPVAALLMNFTKSATNIETLLKHSELVSYFHEFGHMMHHVCSQASFARFSGLQVESDFREAPSHMLENWCYEKESLKMMSCHCKDPQKEITDGLCNLLKAKRKSFPALRALRNHLFLGTLDLILHTEEKIDTELLIKRLYPEVVLGMPMLDGTNLAASTLHLMSGGCDAACYAYLWSEVFAADMFETKFKGNIMNNIVGMEFRNKVLVPGATKDAVQILKDFLGRDPSVDAYLRINGLNQFDDL